MAMLKKELAMHQKRASEALAMQRQQSQRYVVIERHFLFLPVWWNLRHSLFYLPLVVYIRSASNHSDSVGVLSELSDLARPSGNSAPSSTDVAVEMDRMDRIMASHAPPPPPPQKDGEEGEEDESPRPSVEDSDESPTSDKSSQSSSSPSNDVESTTPPEASSGGAFFPHTASPKPKHKLNYNDDYPGDVAPHRASHGSSLPSVQDEEDESSERSQNPPSVSHAREVANMKLSSIDAFEASFDTAFPSSFASPKEGEPVTSEIYNPFFSSPQKEGLGAARSPMNRDKVEQPAGSPEKGRKWGNSVRDRSPAPKSPTSPRVVSADEGSNPNETTPPNKQPTVQESGGEERTRYDARSPDREKDYVESSSRMPDPSSSPKIVSRATNSSQGVGSNGEPHRTPPHFHAKAQEQQVEKHAVNQPRRPEKSISASARARYEKALQPRGYNSHMKDPSADRAMQVETKIDATMEPARNSPGTVLRRLQQRRQKSDRFQPSMDANSNPIPGMDMRRSNRPLRHPPVLPTENGDISELYDDNGRKLERRSAGRNAASQNSGGSYRSSQNDPENNSYQRSRSQNNPAAKKLSPDSMNAEIRALDAMAGSYRKPGGDSPTNSASSSSSSSRYAALKQRRSVKQPISYAEPPLNSKMRRGDEYFPRRTGSQNEDNAVSPDSSPEDLSGTRRASRNRAGASPDEVLKDLGAAVRS